jgi:hypothetical protein
MQLLAALGPGYSPTRFRDDTISEIPLSFRPGMRLVERTPSESNMALISAPSMTSGGHRRDAVAADGAADQALLLGESAAPWPNAELALEALLGALVAHQLQRADQADAARLADQRVIGQRLQPQLEDRRHSLHVRDDLDALVDLDGLERHCAGERMPE